MLLLRWVLARDVPLRRSELAANRGLGSFRCCALPGRSLLGPLVWPCVLALPRCGQLVGEPLACVRGLLAMVRQQLALVGD